MNLTLISAIAIIAFVGDSDCLLGNSFPGLFSPFSSNGGWAMGQEASKNAANFAVDNAITKAGSTELPPELHVNKTKTYFKLMKFINSKYFVVVVVFFGFSGRFTISIS